MHSIISFIVKLFVNLFYMNKEPVDHIRTLQFSDEDTLRISLFNGKCLGNWDELGNNDWCSQVKSLAFNISEYWKVDWLKVLRRFKNLRRIEADFSSSQYRRSLSYGAWIKILRAFDKLRQEKIPGIVLPELVLTSPPDSDFEEYLS